MNKKSIIFSSIISALLIAVIISEVVPLSYFEHESSLLSYAINSTSILTKLPIILTFVLAIAGFVTSILSVLIACNVIKNEKVIKVLSYLNNLATSLLFVIALFQFIILFYSDFMGSMLNSSHSSYNSSFKINIPFEVAIPLGISFVILIIGNLQRKKDKDQKQENEIEKTNQDKNSSNIKKDEPLNQNKDKENKTAPKTTKKD